MKVIKKEIIMKDCPYVGFKLGTDTDLDAIARSCGYLSGETISSLKAVIDDSDSIYELVVDYEAIGDQQICNLDDESLKDLALSINEPVDDVDSALSSARKNKTSLEKDVYILSKVFKSGHEVFRSNCWYEGKACLIQKNKESGEKSIIVKDMFLSEFGLDDVKGSVKDIINAYDNDESIIDLVDWILDE